MFKQWCGSQGFANSSNLSHVLMDGGVLSVPFDRLDDFYGKYVEAVLSGEQIFVVEQKTDTFNFFVDLDYKSTGPLSMERIEHLSRQICDRVSGFGGKSCLISVAKPKKVADNKVKSGVHLNWADFTVDQKAAVALRGHILKLLRIEDPNENWDEIVDKSVYGNPETGTKGSGFRLPWSHKKGKHNECGGKGCLVCGKTGKLTEVEYLPVFKYVHGVPFSMMTRVSFLEPTVELLKAATVRTQDTVPVEVPDPGELVTIKKTTEGKFTRAQTKNEIEDTELSARLETFIRQYLEGQSEARINKIFKHEKVYLVGTTSSYCENLGRKHNSNHIWFLVNEECIRQRCFCQCETLQGRRNGFCKDFSGKKHSLPPTLLNLLFPIKKADTNKAAIRANVSFVRDPFGVRRTVLLPPTQQQQQANS